MAKSLPTRSQPIQLSDTVEHRIKLYSVAAMAAGVSVLAMTQPAESKIVVTNANIAVNPGSVAYIDLNNDGINDFQLSVAIGGYDHSFYATLAIAPLTGGRVVGGNRGPLGPYASALASNANIGPSARFSSSVARGQITIERSNGAESGPTSTYKLYGKWGGAGTRYLGVKFLINGRVHYGWVRMTVSRTIVYSGAKTVSATITEYAYDTVAKAKLGAGETVITAPPDGTAKETGPSIGMLALGNDGLSLWRRE